LALVPKISPKNHTRTYGKMLEATQILSSTEKGKAVAQSTGFGGGDLYNRYPSPRSSVRCCTDFPCTTTQELKMHKRSNQEERELHPDELVYRPTESLNNLRKKMIVSQIPPSTSSLSTNSTSPVFYSRCRKKHPHRPRRVPANPLKSNSAQLSP